MLRIAQVAIPTSNRGFCSGGNPALMEAKPVWRLDQLWPDDPAMVSNYIPLRWDGNQWFPAEHHAGGQPAILIEGGDIVIAVRGAAFGLSVK